MLLSDPQRASSPNSKVSRIPTPSLQIYISSHLHLRHRAACISRALPNTAGRCNHVPETPHGLSQARTSFRTLISTFALEPELVLHLSHMVGFATFIYMTSMNRDYMLPRATTTYMASAQLDPGTCSVLQCPRSRFWCCTQLAL